MFRSILIWVCTKCPNILLVHVHYKHVVLKIPENLTYLNFHKTYHYHSFIMIHMCTADVNHWDTKYQQIGVKHLR